MSQRNYRINVDIKPTVTKTPTNNTKSLKDIGDSAPTAKSRVNLSTKYMYYYNQTGKHTAHNSVSILKEHSFPLVILFGSLAFLATLSSIILFVLLRIAKKSLKRKRNDLYFVEKSIRNSSIVSSLMQTEGLSNERDSVYSHVANTVTPPELVLKSPDLPPRTPSLITSGSPLTPTAPSLSPTKGQTTFTFPPDDIRHDYLELIWYEQS